MDLVEDCWLFFIFMLGDGFSLGGFRFVFVFFIFMGVIIKYLTALITGI